MGEYFIMLTGKGSLPSKPMPESANSQLNRHRYQALAGITLRQFKFRWHRATRPVSALILPLLMLLAWSVAAQGNVTIDNDIPSGTLDHLEVDVANAGNTRTILITGEDLDGGLVTENVAFDYISYIDVGNNGTASQLSGFTASGASLTGDDEVSSSGSFDGENGTINWSVVSSIANSGGTYISVYNFVAEPGTTLGTLRFIQYLDEDVLEFRENIFYGWQRGCGQPTAVHLG